jgi:hypothetical protein
MKPKLLTSVSAFVTAAFLASSAYSQQNPVAPDSAPPAPAPAPNNNVFNPPPPPISENAAGVVRLAGSNVGDDVLVAYVNSSQSMFNLSANDILQLKGQGVSSPVVAAMINHDNSLRNSGRFTQAAYVYNQRNYGQPQSSGGYSQPGRFVNQSAPAYDSSQQAPQYQGTTSPTVIVQPVPQTQVQYVPAYYGSDYYYAPGYWGWNNGWNVGIGVGLGFGWGWGGYPYRWGGHYGGFHGYHGGFHGGGGGFHGGVGFHGGHR